MCRRRKFLENDREKIWKGLKFMHDFYRLWILRLTLYDWDDKSKGNFTSLDFWEKLPLAVQSLLRGSIGGLGAISSRDSRSKNIESVRCYGVGWGALHHNSMCRVEEQLSKQEYAPGWGCAWNFKPFSWAMKKNTAIILTCHPFLICPSKYWPGLRGLSVECVQVSVM